MADNSVAHIGENSPEYVAYKLMELIAGAEGKSFNKSAGDPASRQWILNTYAQCSRIVSSGWEAKSAMGERPVA